MSNLTELNQICIDTGGSGGHLTNLAAFNELCDLLGAESGHLINLPAINAIDVSLGGDGDHLTNLDALNSISTLIGGSGDHLTVLDALIEIKSIGLGSYDPESDPDLQLLYSSRSGNTLLETGSGSSRNAQIIPRVGKLSGTIYLDFGTSYNPSPAVVTIYSAFKRDGTSGNGGILCTASSSSPYNGIHTYVNMSTGQIGVYTNAFKWTTATPASAGTWVRVLWKFTLGNGGKAEIAWDEGNFETLHDGHNFPTSFIPTNGKMTVGAWQGTGGTGSNILNGSMAEVKIWESAKGWADVDGSCDMWIPIAGNSQYEFAMNDSVKLAASWGAAAFRHEYHQYGSTYWNDNGWELWKKASYATPVTQWTPKGCVQTELLAGSWSQIKVYDGSATGFNFFDAYIDFDPTGGEHADIDCWDRDNATIFNDYARVNYTINGYIHQYYTSEPYFWHASEINRNSFKNYCNTNYKNTIFPKATSNSMGFATRNLLTKIYTFSQRTAQETTAIETVTGDKLIAAGINITFDDFSRDANRITSMVDADSRYWQRYFFKYTWYMDVDSDQDLTDNLAALQAILAKEHELANHSVNHPVWTTYVIENGAAALVNNEILPAQTSFDNVLGITPDGYAYHGDMGYNATVNSLLLSNGFDYIRYAVKSPENVINDACYDIVTGGALFPAWYNNETSINDIRGAIDYARDNNKVFVIVFHQLGAVESGTTASYEKIEQILEYILENNMSMYNSSELPNL